MSKIGIEIVKSNLDKMTNIPAKEMLLECMEKDTTIDDYLHSLRSGVIISSRRLEDSEVNTNNKRIALFAVTNNSGRAMSESALREDITVAMDYINKNFTVGDDIWEE